MYDERKIEREIKHLQFAAVQFAGLFYSGIGGYADDYFVIRQVFFKLRYNCFCCVDFADADGVNPDAFFIGEISADFAGVALFPLFLRRQEFC